MVDLLKENPKATYAEAKNYISDKVKGWKLSEEDYEEEFEDLPDEDDELEDWYQYKNDPTYDGYSFYCSRFI